jgi:hypothetical protein
VVVVLLLEAALLLQPASARARANAAAPTTRIFRSADI